MNVWMYVIREFEDAIDDCNVAAAPPPPTWTQPFEWIGVFDTSGDTTHTWLAQKVNGKYADPTMKLVMIATHTPTAATMQSLEGDAAVLIEGNCTYVSSGATLTPTTSGVCYNLMFDSASNDSTFTLNTAGVAGIVFAAEHEPTEFERDTHYLYDSAGADIEPIAQDYDMRYATFGCSFDSESGSLLVSYGEECTDAACGDCAVSATNVPNGACYMAGGHVHYATCDPTGSTVTVEIHQTAGWDCTTDVTGATPDQTHIEPAAGCKVEEHEHEGDGRRLSFSNQEFSDSFGPDSPQYKAVHAWDEGVAFYAGSLEGPNVGGSSAGEMVYRLAEKRCANFGTCESGSTGLSNVNKELLAEFIAGEAYLMDGNCSAVRPIVDTIIKQMTVPLVQGSLRYAYKVGSDPDYDDVGTGRSPKNAAEGAVFTAAVLPLVHECNVAAAKTISDEMKFGLYDQGEYPDFAAVPC